MGRWLYALACSTVQQDCLPALFDQVRCFKNARFMVRGRLICLKARLCRQGVLCYARWYLHLRRL
jgi:hypothetical protein